MKKMTLFGLLLATGIWCAVVLTRTTDSVDVHRDATMPRDGGQVVIGVSSDADSFNPLFNETASAQEITHLLLLGLVDLNDKSEFQPELAESWDFSDDRLELTYHLRQDAAWSDGTPLTADDVKFTFDLLMDDKVASPRQSTTEYMKEVRVQDEHTVTFYFTQAYPDQLFDTAGEILPKHILQGADRTRLRSHPFGRNPISSGPFLLKSWVSEQYIELIPNKGYFGGRPHLDRVIFKIVPDKTNLLMQLRGGEIDMMVDVPLAEVRDLQRSQPDLQLYPVSGRVYYYIGYNEANAMFADRTVRRALTMAIDRKKIVDALLYGFGKECVGPIPPMVPWAYNEDVTPITYDPASAREALKQAGWRDSDGDGWLDRDGHTFAFQLKTNTGNQLRADIAIIVQNQLKAIGVKVNIQTLERSTLIERLRAGEFDAYMGGWSTSFAVDPTPIFHSSSTDLFNFVHYANPAVDHLIEIGREEMDRQTAAGIWKETQDLIYQDQPYTFLFWKTKIVAVDRHFKNVNPIPLSSIYGLENWYKAE